MNPYRYCASYFTLFTLNLCLLFFFFFQAEDGIRDISVTGVQTCALPIFIKPGRPWTNGKAERFNRTLQTEWAYATAWSCNDQRTAALDGWLTHYNTSRSHSALGGRPPISRLAA